jgi:hypothetical protein
VYVSTHTHMFLCVRDGTPPRHSVIFIIIIITEPVNHSAQLAIIMYIWVFMHRFDMYIIYIDRYIDRKINNTPSLPPSLPPSFPPALSLSLTFSLLLSLSLMQTHTSITFF